MKKTEKYAHKQAKTESQKNVTYRKNNTAQGVYRKHKKHTEDNKAYRKHRHSEGDGYSLKRGK